MSSVAGASSTLLALRFQVAAAKQAQDVMKAEGQAALSLIASATATSMQTPRADGKGQLIDVVA